MTTRSSPGGERRERGRQVDSGAVRVSLALASAAAALEPIVVGPSSDASGFTVDGRSAELTVRWLDGQRLVLGHRYAGDRPEAERMTPAGVAAGTVAAHEPATAGDPSRRLVAEGSDTDIPGAERVLLLPPTAVVRTGAVRREVIVGGWRIEVEVEPAARAGLRERATRDREALGHSGPTEVRAIIPGVVVSVAVAVGDRIVAGQQLLAIEAMKMQNELRAARDGTVERIDVAPGRTIDVGELLLVIG